ncbi:Ig-like domain-containing protein [Apilactobacillus quenuiae]|uniref:Ig-like domain-containing protein n=1 Tax=Apilactobacillus quenuiae TaxID=2008377 RepID=UPI000D015DFA|nr:Ig-like domain-containing protein [Apilactobacillus quenuiae]
MKKVIKIAAASLPITFAGSFFMMSGNAHADEINSNSLTNYTYNIKDSSNNDVTQSNSLDKYSDYTISRSFSISDSISIKNGDYVYISLPDNVNSTRNNSFSVKNTSGAVIGNFTAEAGQRVGKLTFTDQNYNDLKNKSINIVESVKGMKDNSITDNSWMINKYGWISHDDPNKIIWNINFNPSNKTISNVQISDTLSSNQTYLGNVSATLGHVDTSNDNQFISDNQNVPVNVSNNNGKLQFSINNGGSINKDVSLVYETKMNQSSENNLSDATNNATISAQYNNGNASDNGNPSFISQSSNARILAGGYGTANGNNNNQTNQNSQPNDDNKGTTVPKNNNQPDTNNSSNTLVPSSNNDNNQNNSNVNPPVNSNQNTVQLNNNNQSPDEHITNTLKKPDNLLKNKTNNSQLPKNHITDVLKTPNNLLKNNTNSNPTPSNDGKDTVKQEWTYKKNVDNHPKAKPIEQHHEPNLFVNKQSNKLPQTGASDNSKLSILGALMIAISSIAFAIFKKRY